MTQQKTRRLQLRVLNRIKNNSLKPFNIYDMSKSTTTVQFSQHLIAGLLKNDSSIEFYGIPQTMEVQWIQNGHSHSFKDIDKKTFAVLANACNSNKDFRDYIKDRETTTKKTLSPRRRVEIYTYFMFGGLDSRPDMVEGKLQDPENYRHSENCPSLKFKKIRLNGSPLKIREIRMIDLMLKDFKDEVVAHEMGITRSTLEKHKTALYNKTGTQSKPGLLVAAMRNRVARVFSPAV